MWRQKLVAGIVPSRASSSHELFDVDLDGAYTLGIYTVSCRDLIYWRFVYTCEFGKNVIISKSDFVELDNPCIYWTLFTNFNCANMLPTIFTARAVIAWCCH